MNELYAQYENKRKAYLAKALEKNKTEMIARGVSKDVTDLWFG